jgi:2'-5' RNA ligase
MSKIRTFIAIPIVGITSLEQWMNFLKRKHIPGRFKWNEKELWHLTFRFVGDVNKAELGMLRDSLRHALRDCESGEIVVEKTGIFGNSLSPKVLWAGIRESRWLEDVKERVDRGVSVLDLPSEERAFHPHLTLARIKYLEKPEVLMNEVEKKKKHEWGRLKPEAIVLYKSRLTPGGPAYSRIEEFGLIS